MISSVLVIFCFADSKQCLMTDFIENLLHSAERIIGPSFLFPSPLLDIPPFFRNMQPLYPLLLIPTLGKSAFSGRLKIDNIKPCKPITYRNCVSWPYSGWVFSGPLTDMGGGGRQKAPKICHIYPTMMKLGSVIPYLKNIQQLYESRDTPLEKLLPQPFLK